MNPYVIDPTAMQALVGSGLGTGYLGSQVGTAVNNIYNPTAVGGNNHLVSTDVDFSRQAEAAAGMPIATKKLPNGLAKPSRIRLKIDTSGLAAGGTVGLKTVKLWDIHGYFDSNPQTMAASTISTLPTISVNGQTGLYNAFKNRLSSQTLYIMAMTVTIDQAGDCDCCGFPKQLNENINVWKVNEEGAQNLPIWLSDMRNPTAFRSNLGAIALTEAQMRLDRETAWIWQVYDEQIITLDLHVAVYEHNS